MFLSIITEQEEIIKSLASHNRHLINLLAQYMSIEEEEARLERSLRGSITEEEKDNGLDT